MPAMGHVLSRYLPPPPSGSRPPSRWGDPEAVTQLLGDAGWLVTSSLPRELDLSFPDAEAATTLLVDTAGHLVAERERLTAERRWNTLLADMRSFVNDHGVVDDNRFLLRLEYLLVTVRLGRNCRGNGGIVRRV